MRKLIYSNDRIGDIKGQLVDNEIKGVFGNVVDVTKVPRDNPNIPNILTNESRGDNYLYSFSKTIYSDTSGSDSGIMYINSNMSATMTYTLNFDITLNYNYNNPIENIQPIEAKLVYDNYSRPLSGLTLGDFAAIGNFIRNTSPISKNQPLGEAISRPAVTNWNITTDNIIAMTVSNVFIDSFRVSFRVSLNEIVTRSLSYLYQYINAGGTTLQNDMSASANVMQPKYIDIIVRGDTYRITPQAFQYGSIKNAYEVMENTLITTKTTSHGKSYTEHLYDKMAGNNGEWKNGKRCFNIEVVAPFELHQIEDDIAILQTRRGDINEANPQSINETSVLTTPEGETIDLEITSAEFRYNGSNRQILDVLEKIK